MGIFQFVDVKEIIWTLKYFFFRKKLKKYILNIINFWTAIVKNLLNLTVFKQNKRNVNFINVLSARQIIRLPKRKIAKNWLT